MSSLVAPGSFSSSKTPWDPLNVGQANITNDTENIKKIVLAGTQNGWISAGSFYFIFNQSLTPKLLKTATDNAENINDKATIPVVVHDKTYPPPLAFLSSMARGGGAITLSDDRKTATITNTLITENPPDANNPNGSQTTTTTTESATVKNFETAKKLDVTTLQNLARYLTYGGIYYIKDAGSSDGNSSAFSSTDSPESAISGLAGGANASIIHTLSNLMEGSNADPLMAHAIFGRNLMIGSEVAMMALLAASIAIMYASGVTVLGTGSSGAAIALLTFVALIFGFLGSIWAFGAALAIYGPFIPFMIFTLTALGWLLTVVEAIIAAPIIALGLVMPSGDEMGKLSHALMLLANIFLRPMLMIFGFILAGGVYKAIVKLIDFGMANVMQSVQVNSMFSSLAIIAVYTTFILSVTNLAFSLIYAVPDKILRWLGVSGEQTNVSAVGEVKQASSASNKAIGGELSREAGAGANALGRGGAKAAGEAGEAGGGAGGAGGAGGKGRTPWRPGE